MSEVHSSGLVCAIVLTKFKVAFVDAADYDLVSGKQWQASLTRGHCYAKRDRVFMHRLIMGAKKGEYVDHLNDDGRDNRRCNLRICTNGENLSRQKGARRYGYKGVYHSRRTPPLSKPWEAAIQKDRKIHLGYFATAEEAARAYDRAAKEHRGVYATLNFPDEV